MQKFMLLPLVLIGCERAVPEAEVRSEAHRQIENLLNDVDRFSNEGATAVAYRLRYADVALELSSWSWNETEVFAERRAGTTRATTISSTYVLDPLRLAPPVRATYSNEAWGLELRCADGTQCVAFSRDMTVIDERGNRTRGTQAGESGRHEWRFDRFEDRDAAIVAVRRAIGAPAR